MITTDEMKEKIQKLLTKCADSGGEKVGAIVNEWVALGKEKLPEDQKQIYNQLLDRIGGSYFVYTQCFDPFLDKLRNLSFEDALNVYDNLTEENLGYYRNELLANINQPQGKLDNKTRMKFENILQNLKYGQVRDGFWARVKNIDVSLKNREKINENLKVADVMDLKPEFHDLRTLGVLMRPHSEYSTEKRSGALKKVLGYVAGDYDAAYYRLMGSGVGKRPETQTEIVDKIFEKINDEYKETETANSVRKHFIMKDILAGRGDKLDVKDIASVVNEGDGLTLMSKMSVDKISELYYGNAYVFREKPHLKLAAINKLMTVKEQTDYYYGHLMTAGRDVLLQASQSKEAKEFVKTAEDFVNEFKNSDNVKEAEKKLREQQGIIKELSSVRNEYNQKDNIRKKMQDVQDIWKRMKENTADGQEGVSQKDLEKEIECAINGKKSAFFDAPKAKLPLFGRKEAKEKQARLESAVVDFNRWLSSAGLGELKDYAGKVLEKDSLNGLEEKLNTLGQTRDTLAKSVSGMGNLYYEQSVVGQAKRVASTLEEIKTVKEKGDKIAAVKLEILQKHGEKKVVEASEERGKKPSDRQQQPKTKEEKTEAAKKAYDERKKLVANVR